VLDVWLCSSETAGGDGGGGSSSSSVSQRGCGSDDAAALTTAVDVKCTSPRDNNDSTAAAVSLPFTSSHVTSEHDHMVSSTIHSDGQCPDLSLSVISLLSLSPSISLYWLFSWPDDHASSLSYTMCLKNRTHVNGTLVFGVFLLRSVSCGESLC